MLSAAGAFARSAARPGPGRGVLLRGVALRAAGGVLPAASPSASASTPPRACLNQQRAPFSAGTTATKEKVVVDVRRSAQREIWKDYLSGKTSATDLFAEIDLNYSGTICVKEINYFLNSVQREGVSKRAFNTLQRLGEDQGLNVREFAGWLNMATADRSGEEEEEESAPAAEAAPESASEKTAEEGAERKRPVTKKTVVDARQGLQRLIWDEYLSTGRHGDDLFLLIDLNRNGTVSVEEIVYFLDSVGRKGVFDAEFDRLVAMGDDHEIGRDEFLEWLSDAAEIEEHGDARLGSLHLVRQREREATSQP